MQATLAVAHMATELGVTGTATQPGAPLPRRIEGVGKELARVVRSLPQRPKPVTLPEVRTALLAFMDAAGIASVVRGVGGPVEFELTDGSRHVEPAIRTDGADPRLDGRISGTYNPY